jgi:hypothetical protein
VFNEKMVIMETVTNGNGDKQQQQQMCDYEHLHTLTSRQRADHQYQSMLPAHLTPSVHVHSSAALVHVHSAEKRADCRSPVRTQLNATAASYQRLHSEPATSTTPSTATPSYDRVVLSPAMQRLAGAADDVTRPKTQQQQQQLATDSKLLSPRIVPKMGTKSGLHSNSSLTVNSPARTKSHDQNGVEERRTKTTEVMNNQRQQQQQRVQQQQQQVVGCRSSSTTNKENVVMATDNKIQY